MRNHMVNTNRLFVALKGADRARLAPHMRRFELLKDAVLYEIGDPIDTLYFPLSGQVALVIVSEDGSETESTSIGNNGVVGLGGLISGDKSFTCQRVQVAGEALALPRGPFLQVYHESRDFRNVIAAHQDAFTAQLLQSVHCQGNHFVDQRVARWLLSAFDSTLDQPLDLTQEALAEALGVRRATVTTALKNAVSNGSVQIERGKVLLVDRERLESQACTCYGIIRRAFERATGEL
jgi:CRP-like cAMP-binding protein